MIKRFRIYALLILLFVFFGLYKSKGQSYGNEWINYEQNYFEFKVVQNGIYKIDYTTLNQAFLQVGLDLNTVHPSWFQIYGRGEQSYIYIKDEFESDGVFDSDDYIEFFAQKNDGWFDARLYEYDEGQHQPNPNYSLFNDTATYFLTWNPTAPKNRITLETNVDFTGYTQASYFYYDSRVDYTTSYFFGETDFYDITEPEFSNCEGWFDGGFTIGGSMNKSIPTANKYTTSENSIVKFQLLGQSNTDHHVAIDFANQTIDTIYNDFVQLNFSVDIPTNQLGSSNTSFTFTSIDDQGSNADRNTISYISVRYPHTYDLEGKSEFFMSIPNSAEEKTYINASNFTINSGSPFIYDITNNKKITAISDGSNVKALIPNTGAEKQCLISSEGSVFSVTVLSPANGSSTFFTDFKELHGGTNYYVITNSTLLSKANEYAAYRSMSGYSALAIDIEELYSQFAYGINKHPQSIRNFMDYALNEFDSIPRYLFLVGKGYPVNSFRNNPVTYAETIIPAFGYPPTDILFTSGLNGANYQFSVPTGRLAAKEIEHFDLYLDKVVQYEQAQEAAEEWMKYALHFGGGSSQNEQQQLAGYLRNYENILEDTLFGGYVRTFLKTSPDPIEFNQSDSLKNIINNGVSLMTFFGHAAGIGFDQSIDDINEYDNVGKYPFLLANSCWAGDIFSPSTTTSEEFVLIRDKGMIGFLASITAAVSSYLNTYSTEFYKAIAYRNYGGAVGDVMKEVINIIESDPNYANNNSLMKTCQLIQLHGDPAIKINAQSKPDYLINQQSFYTSPYEVTSEQDSFYVNVQVMNIGKAIAGNYTVRIERIYSDGSSEFYLSEIEATRYKDTLQIKLPVDREIGVGLNQLKVDLDYNDDFDEISEANNSYSYDFFIKSTDIVPVYPYEFAIVPNSSVVLKASSGDPFGKEMDYIFQIDTNDNFNSSSMVEQKVNQQAGVVSWNPPISFMPDRVYYWRVRLDSAYSEDPIWRSSSFKYSPNKEGWGQSHFYQFANDVYQFVNFNRDQRKFDFTNNKLVLTAQNGYNIPYNDIWYKINGTLMEYRSCAAEISDGGIKFAVFDSISAEPWVSSPSASGYGPYGNFHCYENRDSYEIEFATNTTTLNDITITREEWLNRIKEFINSIPSGNEVLVMSYKNLHTSHYNETLFEAFEKLGSNYIRNLQNGDSYILFGTKKDFAHPGSANEVVGTESGVHINLEDSISTNWKDGFVESSLIGPAKQWQSMIWDANPSSTDSVDLEIYGVKINGIEDTIMKGIQPSESTVDLNGVDANTYPYLKLKVNMKDDSLYTPAQMSNWEVYYQGVPETAIDPQEGFFFHKDTLLEGDKLNFATAIHNISNFDMDSLLVNYWIVDKNRVLHPIDYPRQREHPSGDVFIDTVVANTKGIAGLNSLWIEVNPNNDQLEQYHFNNLGELFFYVEQDNTNPLLDVTFDGIHILNGDIVSAKPLIQISLKDENQFLELDDTSLFKVFLKYPEEEVARQVYFNQNGQEMMRFYPADEENKCKIEYAAEFSQDGIYELLVQAKDATGNESGDVDYKISFEVINESSITKIMNWPNPFSTRTHFVFTLTGSQLPDHLKIQIITVTGKLIREITMDELGPIHIGRNITEYAWDGRDEYGDKLGNGVYLYRVIARLNGEKIENRSSGADKFFKKEFGKMYIMR